MDIFICILIYLNCFLSAHAIHCYCNSLPCFDNGTCEPGLYAGCTYRQFGYSCQYIDLVNKRSIFKELKDTFDDTCVTDTIAIPIKFYKHARVRFVRVRVTDNSKYKMLEFVFFLNDTPMPCYGIVKISGTNLIEYHCKLTVKAEALVIRQAAEIEFCQIEISNGRNLGPLAKTDALTPDLKIHSIKGLTDGITDFRMQSCYLEPEDNFHSRVEFKFPVPILLSEVEIFDNAPEYQTNGTFTIEIAVQRGSGALVTVESQETNTFIPTRDVQNVTQIIVRSSERFSSCEIKIIGDCPRGKYGLSCEHNCPGNCKWCTVEGVCLTNCSPYCVNDNCDDNKGCLEGCVPGFYGRNCNFECSTCLSGLCDDRGYCKNGCVFGFFGAKCESMSSPYCAADGSFDENGLCSHNCKAGYYGPKCSHSCSPGCDGDGSCRFEGGECSQGCRFGYYGSKCTEVCNNCLNDACNDHGICHYGCKTCFFGPNCIYGKSSVELKVYGIQVDLNRCVIKVQETLDLEWCVTNLNNQTLTITYTGSPKVSTSECIKEKIPFNKSVKNFTVSYQETNGCRRNATYSCVLKKGLPNTTVKITKVELKTFCRQGLIEDQDSIIFTGTINTTGNKIVGRNEVYFQYFHPTNMLYFPACLVNLTKPCKIDENERCYCKSKSSILEFVYNMKATVDYSQTKLRLHWPETGDFDDSDHSDDYLLPAVSRKPNVQLKINGVLVDPKNCTARLGGDIQVEWCVTNLLNHTLTISHYGVEPMVSTNDCIKETLKYLYDANTFTLWYEETLGCRTYGNYTCALDKLFGNTIDTNIKITKIDKNTMCPEGLMEGDDLFISVTMNTTPEELELRYRLEFDHFIQDKSEYSSLFTIFLNQKCKNDGFPETCNCTMNINVLQIVCNLKYAIEQMGTKFRLYWGGEDAHASADLTSDYIRPAFYYKPIVGLKVNGLPMDPKNCSLELNITSSIDLSWCVTNLVNHTLTISYTGPPIVSTNECLHHTMSYVRSTIKFTVSYQEAVGCQRKATYSCVLIDTSTEVPVVNQSSKASRLLINEWMLMIVIYISSHF